MPSARQISLYITSALQYTWAFVFLLLPLFFITLTTEYFVLPKQILLTLATLLSILALGVQMFFEKKVKIRSTVFDLPIVLFIVALILSVLFSASRIDAIIAFVPFLIVCLTYFLITNIVRTEQIAFLFISSLVVAACISALISIFSFLKIYILPFAFTHVPFFTTIGSVFDAAVFFIAILPITITMALPLIQKPQEQGKTNTKAVLFAAATFILVAGAVIELYQLFTTQKPIILPFASGFQIAFAAISQDAPRIAQGFFFGSGIGTFFSDFTRFKQVAFNADPTIWFINFGQSSSFVLELLATTGVVGVFAFFFIIVKTITKSGKKLANPIFLSSLLLAVGSLLIPFSFTTLTLFFFLLGLFAAMEGLKHPEKSFDLEFFLVTLRKNLFNYTPEQPQPTHTTSTSKIMPAIIFVGELILVGVVGYFAFKYTQADYLFNNSLIAASKNQGTQTYQLQVQAISTFPYRESFYRIFSQTNLSIANSLLVTASQNGAKPSQDVQNTALSLIQQSINIGRAATTLSPINTLEWQNLANIYRALIGFGQNAESFAVASQQQAIQLDPANPQEYISLGGILYQLGQYDDAIRQFQTAINVKPDLANAYYNLGHAYEQKGDLQSALTNYQAVRTLVANDKTNVDKINQEITAIQNKIGGQQQAQTPSNLQPAANQEPLNVQQQPQTQIPPVTPQVPLPGPKASPTPTK